MQQICEWVTTHRSAAFAVDILRSTAMSTEPSRLWGSWGWTTRWTTGCTTGTTGWTNGTTGRPTSSPIAGGLENTERISNLEVDIESLQCSMPNTMNRDLNVKFVRTKLAITGRDNEIEFKQRRCFDALASPDQDKIFGPMGWWWSCENLNSCTVDPR